MTSNDKSDENNDHKETKDQSIIIKYGLFPNILMKLGFKHIDADEDGLYDGLIVPKSHANVLCWTSCLSVGSLLYGLYKRQYKFLVYPLGILMSFIIFKFLIPLVIQTVPYCEFALPLPVPLRISFIF